VTAPARGKRRFLIALCVLGALLFAGLGVWQVERLAWKLELIARVDARVHAPPAPVPLAAWRVPDARRDEYRHVRVRGTYLHDRATLIEALTERGAGFWVVTPLQTDKGLVLINRGFVPSEDDAAIGSESQGPATVTGLLRMTEPGGRFLRSNDPLHGRWFSRDVAAIARARGLGPVAPFFIDADAAPSLGSYPIGGLTVVSFRNAHLVYALTWFALAALCLAGLVLVLRSRDTAD
jgi:surfeit locus 1 family protein